MEEILHHLECTDFYEAMPAMPRKIQSFLQGQPIQAESAVTKNSLPKKLQLYYPKLII